MVFSGGMFALGLGVAYWICYIIQPDKKWIVLPLLPVAIWCTIALGAFAEGCEKVLRDSKGKRIND